MTPSAVEIAWAHEELTEALERYKRPSYTTTERLEAAFAAWARLVQQVPPEEA